MSDPLERSRSLDARLIQGRESGAITEEEDDRIADAMESLWWELTDEERAEIDARVSACFAVRLGEEQPLTSETPSDSQDR